MTPSYQNGVRLPKVTGAGFAPFSCAKYSPTDNTKYAILNKLRALSFSGTANTFEAARTGEGP